MDELLIYFTQHTLVFYSITFIVSLCVGSFLNVVIYRLPIMMNQEWTKMCYEHLALEQKNPPKHSFNLAYPRSHCTYCQHQLKWWHNIPLLSYLLLRGQCFFCHKKISSRYFLIELLTAALALMVINHFDISLKAFYVVIFTWTLLTLAMIDIDTQLLPDNLTLSLLWLGLIVNTQNTFISSENAILTCAGSYLLLFSFLKIFSYITGKDGMGLGDVKLFAALGAWLGWQQMPIILLMSSLVGSIVGIVILSLTKKGKDTPLAFGQYLCLAGFISILYGKPIISAYLSLY